MKSHQKRLVSLAKTLTPALLNMQEMDKDSIDYGDFVMQKKGFSEQCSLSMPIMHFVGMYYTQQSPYYNNKDLLTRSSLMMDIILRVMHEDGTLDLKETNFHDATVIAFMITPIAHTFRAIKKLNDNLDIENELMDKMMIFFDRGAKGMANGGFHTPNHRWVMAAALSLVYNILGENKYKIEAMKYINEGIDCDEEGEYIERSVAIYDVAVNESLIVIAQELDMPELLDYVARNTRKNFAYLESDGAICTLNSSRQDNSMKYYPLRHYQNTVFLAHYFNDKFFAGMAEYLLTLMEKQRYSLVSYLFTGGKEDLHTPIILYMLDESLSDEIKDAEFNWDGHWYFPINGIVRKRDNNTSLTLLRDREVFMKYQHGNNVLTAKIASSFFGQGYFTPTNLEKIDNGYRMTAVTSQGYYKPLNKKIDDKEFYNIRQIREKTHIQEHKTCVDIILCDDKIKLKVNIDGVANVPVKIELILSEGGRLETNDIIIDGNAGNSLVLKNGDAIYNLDRDIIKIENGTSAHWNTSNMRGTSPASNEHFTVYMTGFTPFEHEIVVSGGK